MSSETQSFSVNLFGRVAVLVAAVLLGLFAGVLAVSFGVFLSRSWAIGVQTTAALREFLLVALIFVGLLSACLYSLLYSLVQLQRRLNHNPATPRNH